ncbi:MAG: polysaccharide biosynthesis C-terminal domain-containing protein [Ferruginibacter sp.]
MIDLAKILKHNVIGKLLNHFVVFIINILIVRLLQVGESGAYFNELYVLNFIVFIFSAGLDYAAIALLAQEPKLLPVIRRMLFKVVLLFAAIMLFYGLVLLPYSNNYFKQPAVSIILFSVGNLLLIFYQGILSALKKFNQQNVILLTGNMLFLLFLWIILKPGIAGNVRNIQLGYAFLFFLQGIIMWQFSRQGTMPVSVTVSWNLFARQGFFIMVASLVYFAFLRVDNFFVAKYTDDTTLGNYVQCGKIGQYFLYFSSAISSTLLPFISAESIGNSFAEWKKMMKPYMVLLCSLAIVIGISGKIAFPWLFGDDFKDMHTFMLILLPGFVCLGMLTLMNAVYIGKGNIRKILFGDIIGLVIVMTFDTWLVPLYGALAAAIISSVAYCIVFFYLLMDFKKQFTLPAKTSEIIKI